MPECKHYKICGLDANPGEDFCILHSQHSKDYGAFEEALAEHRKEENGNFRYFVFPGTH